MICVYTLFSGSSGNSIYVKGDDSEIIIDAGKSCGAIEKALNALGSSLRKIKGIFITHEHSDHTSGLEIISKKYQIPVYMTAPSYDNYVRGGSYLERMAKREPVSYEKDVGSLHISSFPVPHDSAQNVGFVIKDKDCSFGIATDIGHPTKEIADKLSLCEKIIIESNHDIKMVESGPYPQFLKERILSNGGHLSNDKCAELCAYLCDRGVKEITLAHLSKENNLPKLAYEAVRCQLNCCGFENVALKVAFADIAVEATGGREYPFPISKE
ncbi:MAG: MBL fold metallo-hydrolase [Clostridia bacterium]|nr:MBL fold metallo-hydrolase [Clostridia bacterium]